MRVTLREPPLLFSSSHEPAALKFLLPAALGSADATERSAREARAAAKIKSEHVARVIDVDVLESGAPYMVMEYLEGADLATVARDRGPFAPVDVERRTLSLAGSFWGRTGTAMPFEVIMIAPGSVLPQTSLSPSPSSPSLGAGTR